MHISKYTHKENLTHAITNVLGEVLKKYRDTDVLLLCSGGSALALLENVPDGIDWTRMTVGLVDERWKAQRDNRNNEALAQTTFVTYTLAHGAKIITISHDVVTKEIAAQDYEELLRAWHDTYPNGRVCAIFGIGSDGHTAGMMPFPENAEKFETFFNSTQWVAGYDATGKNPFVNRVTITCEYLREHVDSAIVYAVGRGKEGALKKIIADDGSRAQTPARIFREMKDVHIFTDSYK